MKRLLNCTSSEMVNMTKEELKQSILAVSYTHLDVYKRQIYL